MPRFIYWFLAAILLLQSPLATFAAKVTPAASPAKHAARVLSDAELERAIKARFARSKINADGFTVKVQAGAAILEGHTDVIQHKGTATRMAHSAGAMNVQNRIQISEAARARAAANLAKGRKKAELRRASVRSAPRSQAR